MPLYEYICKECDAILEVHHGMFEEHKSKCSVCNSKELTKMISVTSRPQFRGSGFYETDYKSKES
jgi:putative FmdB family regulatory protein